VPRLSDPKHRYKMRAGCRGGIGVTTERIDNSAAPDATAAARPIVRDDRRIAEPRYLNTIQNG